MGDSDDIIIETKNTTVSMEKGENDGPVSLDELYRAQLSVAQQQGKLFGLPTRYVLVFVTCICITISYANRSVIAIAIIPMSQEYGWGPATEGAIFSSFFYGYLSTQLAGGYLSDKHGSKYVMAIASLAWSVITLLTPLAARFHLSALIASRVLLGVAAGVSYPSVHSIIGKWLPISERSLTSALMSCCGGLGAVLALTISAPIAASTTLGWPWPFYLFGLAGLVWLIPWMLFVQSFPPQPLPAEALATNGADSSAAQAIPWSKILRNTYVWAILINNFCLNWGSFVFVTWLPIFYRQAYGIDLKDVGLLTVVPYALPLVVVMGLGSVADYLVYQRNVVSLVFLRKSSQVFGLVMSATFLMLLPTVSSRIGQAIAFLSVAAGFASLTSVGSAMAHFDINPKLAGIIYGMSNTSATLAGIIGMSLTGLILKWTNGNWFYVFFAIAVNYIVGAFFWLLWAHPDNKIHM